MTPPIRFDVTPIINLALAQSATIEKRTSCDRCLDERRRLLEYALGGALEVLGFELVRLKGLDG